MISIFFYRQYPCHIGKTDIRLILHPVPQKIQIFPPVIFFTPRFPENTVPYPVVPFLSGLLLIPVSVYFNWQNRVGNLFSDSPPFSHSSYAVA